MSALFLKIISMSMSASWLILAVLLLRLFLLKAPKWIHVLLWGIVALRLICPFSIESPWSLVPDDIGSGELISDWAELYIGDITIHHPGSTYYDAAIDAGREPIYDGESGYYVITKQGQLDEPSTIENTLVPRLSIVWAGGVSLFLLYTAISYWRLRRRVAAAVRYEGNIFQSEYVRSPFVLGVIKPRIYLPFRMDEQALAHVVAHECSHIRRKDHWWKPLGFLLLSIHWFNPLMWLAYVLLCRDIELACDEKVVKELGSEQRAEYSQALLSCSVNRRSIAACPLAFGEVGVKERVKSVMNYKKPAFWIIAAAVLSCAVVAICFLTDPQEPIEGYYRIGGYGIESHSTGISPAYHIVVGDDIELKCTKEQYEQVKALVERFRTGELEDTPIHVTYNQFLISHKRGTLIELKIPENICTGATYMYEKEGIIGSFTITLYDDGTFKYSEGMASSYYGIGTWTEENDIITLRDNALGGYGLVNRFTHDGNGLVFIQEGSSGFIYVKVQQGERFRYSGEAFKPHDGAKEPEQPALSRKLTLEDVLVLSQKGNNLSWKDFENYSYIETGSGLYIRLYEIDANFHFSIGGAGPESIPVYMFLGVSGEDTDARIDIREEGVAEFIAKHHAVTAFELFFAGNTSLLHKVTLTESHPYATLWIVNEGSEAIAADVGGHVYTIEAGSARTIHTDKTWAAGTYTVGFATKGSRGMEGYAVVKTSSAPLSGEAPAPDRADLLEYAGSAFPNTAGQNGFSEAQTDALLAYAALLSPSMLSISKPFFSGLQTQRWWIPDFEDTAMNYEYTYMDLDGDGIWELLVQLEGDPAGYNAVFHYEDGKLSCWNSDASEMSCRDYPLIDGTMVRQYDYSGSRSYTLFRYTDSGEAQTLTQFFAREELVNPASSEPCPYYAIDGNEVDQALWEQQLKDLVTSRILESSAWTKL